MNGYQQTAVWIYRYKRIVNGNKEEEIALNLILVLMFTVAPCFFMYIG